VVEMVKNRYKETEVGKLPEEWEIDSLKNHLIIKGRIGWKGLMISEYINKGPYIVGGLQIINDSIDWDNCAHVTEERYAESPEIMLKEDDILMTKDGTIGKLAYIKDLPDKATVASHIHVIRRKTKNIHPKFLFYFFKTPIFRALFESKISGSVVPALTQRDIETLNIPLPSIPEQTRIAEILSSIDDKIELNHQMNATLEKITQALFKHWFVEFEFPNEKGKPYKSSGGKMVDSELGEIPRGWRVGKCEEVIEITSGKRPNDKSDVKTSEFNIPLIGASSIMGFVKESLYDEPIIVIGRVGTHGIVQRVLYPSFPSDNTLVIKSKYYGYAYHLLKTIDYESLNVGTTQPLITQSGIKNLKMIIPQEKVVDQYESTIQDMFIKIHQNNAEIETLSSIRDSLLPRLMSGKIRVNVGASS
jgi:type I restriction enzyme S subunit